MAYQVLARKWRPKQFEEVIGQGHVTRTLQNAIKQNKLAHAYLFTGTRGVGKTSIARLFAKAIRCENRKEDSNPCLVCQSCRDIDTANSMDYIEIDGASNNSVDDVRALIENVQYLPTRGSHKIYVIDEVHMLSVSAFNALLKTLEEPPAHAIFILATTDPHKLLGTVISRCQRYDFKNVPVDVLAQHISHIASVEGIKFSTPRIAVKLAELGKGSVRDTLSIFDQVLGLAGSENITEVSLTQALGLAGTSAMKELVSGILKSEPKVVAKVFNGLIAENIDLKKLCDQILDSFYLIINGIDDQRRLVSEEIISDGALSDISVAELFWIYETLVKDFSWTLTSLNPEKVTLVTLQKMAVRRTILSAQDSRIEPGKPQEEVAPPKTWNDFLENLRKTAAATAANLEHGNLLSEMDFSVSPLTITVAFPELGAVFKEYVEEKDINLRLRQQMASFFEVELDKLVFRTKLLSDEEKKDKNFKTKVELDEERIANLHEQKRQSILNDPFVKEAERLFNSKIDKIVLND